MKQKKEDIVIILEIIIICLLSIIIINSRNKTEEIIETEDVSLIQLDYYQKHLLNQDNYQEVLNSKKDFLLYYHSTDCSACLTVDEIIQSYLEKGYGQYLEIYFVEEDFQLLFKDIDYVPLLIQYIKGEEIERKEGIEDIFDFLNEVVINAQ